MSIYDFLYCDLHNVISLYSQLTGGIVEQFETTSENAKTADNKRRYDFRVFQHDAGGTEHTRRELKEVIKPYHAIYSELEKELVDQGYLIDVDELPGGVSLRTESVRNQLKNTLCLKVRGRAVIEDYQRLDGIAESYPKILGFINKSIEVNLRDSEEYKSLADDLEAQKTEIKQVKDRNLRAAKENQVRQLKTKIDALIKTKSQVKGVDQWILDGLRLWITTYLPNITNIRIYPSARFPDEQVFGHLKREGFEDADSTSWHFAYGSVPTEPLTMIGVVTSVPMEGEDDFHPLAEFENRSELNTNDSVESAFRGVFRGFDGFERMIRTSKYPRVLVRPLLVYRSSGPKSN